MVEHSDALIGLNNNIAPSEKLNIIYRAVKQQLGFLDRISVVLYDPKTDWLKTFLSGGDQFPLTHYEAKLSETASLQEIVNAGKPRVVNDLQVFSESEHQHTKRIMGRGYSASYTLPMILDSQFCGFIFFNSYQKGVFKDNAFFILDFAAHLISTIVMSELRVAKALFAAVKTASAVVHLRDLETGYHLDRMANYARLIAKELGDEYGFDDERVEHMFLFAPLHDVGKVAIPDNVLLKQGRLDEKETAIMHTHSEKGREIIDNMLKNFGLENQRYADMLRNIALYHHESYDGSGYPEGLKGEQIPIEARITTVADMFDALTSRRSYKEPWTNDQAFAKLRELAGTKLDSAAVEALTRSKDQIEQIQARFKEEEVGKALLPPDQIEQHALSEASSVSSSK